MLGVLLLAFSGVASAFGGGLAASTPGAGDARPMHTKPSASAILREPSLPLQPTVQAIGVPVADQLERAEEIVRFVTQDLRLHDAERLGFDPITWASTIPYDQSVHIAAIEPAGEGRGSSTDPVRIGADARGLREALENAVNWRSGDLAIYLDNTIDTSLSPTPFAGVSFNTSGSDDRIQVLAWDRTGEAPWRVPVIDGFQTIDRLAAPGASWVHEGEGVWAITLDPALWVLPVMVRLGPAGQHVHDREFVFEASAPNAASLDGSPVGEHRFHIDAATRTLRVRLADASHPGLADVRASVQQVAAFFFNTRRTFVDGLRVSGYDAAGAPNSGYNVFFEANPNSVHVARRVRCDFALRHVMGMAGGGRDARFSHWDCEFGIGWEVGNGGITQSVAYARSGGQHYTGVRPLFAEPSLNTRRGAASIMHRGNTGRSGSWVYVSPIFIADSGTGLRVGGHQNRDPDAYSLIHSPVMEQRLHDPRSVVLGHTGREFVHADVGMRFDARAPWLFAGIETNGRTSTEYRASRLALGGIFAPSVTGAQAVLHTRGGSNSFATNGQVRYVFRDGVIDLSSWAVPGTTGMFQSTTLEAAASAEVPLMLEITDSVIHAPESSGFQWFVGYTRNDPVFLRLSRFEDCLFIGDWLIGQVPQFAPILSREAWAATDPQTLRPGQATAWLIDHAGYLDAARAAALAEYHEGFVVIDPDPRADPDSRCVVAVGVAPTATPTDTQLIGGMIGVVPPAIGGTVDVRGRSGGVFVFVYDPETGLVRASRRIGPGPFTNPDITGPALDAVPDGQVDGFDLNFFIGVWQAQLGPVPPDNTGFSADITGPALDGFADGVVDLFDFNYYTTLWERATAPEPPTPEPEPCPADFTGPALDGIPDGRVDAFDLNFFITLWLASDPRADITGAALDDTPDGQVNAFDLVRYIELWFDGIESCVPS